MAQFTNLAKTVGEGREQVDALKKALDSTGKVNANVFNESLD
jgi:hypothetical protein